MERPILIHQHYFGTGGLGDFLRGIITLYQICKYENIDYYIDLSKNPSLMKCFNVKKIPEHIKHIDFEEHNLFDIITGKNENVLLSFINYVKINKYKVHYIYFNGYGNFNFLNQLNDIKFISNNIISPNDNVIKLTNNIMKKYKLIENNYISIHFRCGDVYIANENRNNIIFDNGDNRIDIGNPDTIKKYDNLIKDFIKKYNIDLPIVIHSDFKYFKNKLRELDNKYIVLNIDIQHIANMLGNNTDESYISTISEFYIISKAKSVVMLNIYSGFPHIACLFGNNSLYTNIDYSVNNNIFNYLKPDTIINI